MMDKVVNDFLTCKECGIYYGDTGECHCDVERDDVSVSAQLGQMLAAFSPLTYEESEFIIMEHVGVGMLVELLSHYIVESEDRDTTNKFFKECMAVATDLAREKKELSDV